MSAAAMSLYHRGAAIQRQRQVGISGRSSFVARNSQGSEYRSHDVTDIGHRADIGTSAPARAAGHISADPDGSHENTSSSIGTTYRRREMNTPTTRNGKLSPQCIDRALGPIIRNRSVKAIAHAAGRSAATIKQWRQTALPEAFAALVNLLTHDDEVYLAVMELANRKPAAALTDNQKRALAEALKMLGME